MGLYDRQYYRDDETGALGAHGPRTMVTTLIIINVAVFVVDMFFGQGDLMRLLALSPATLVRPWLWWQFLTNGFAHASFSMGIEHILFNMFALWMFGYEVEDRHGKSEFLRFYLGALLFGSIVWAVRNYLMLDSAELRVSRQLVGASGAVTAVVLLYCMHNPHRQILLMFVLPAPAWVLGALIVAFNILGLSQQSTLGSGGVAYDVHLAGAAFAGAYFYFGWNLGRFSPSLPTHWFRRRPKLRIHRPKDKDVELEKEADRILAKLHRDGEESLTAKERKLLEEYSRRVRERRE